MNSQGKLFGFKRGPYVRFVTGNLLVRNSNVKVHWGESANLKG